MADDPLSTPLLVRDLMTVGVLTVPPDAPLADVTRLVLDEDVEGVVVVDQEGHGVGVVTRDDLVRGYAHPRTDALTAGDVMREGVPELPPDIPLQAAASLMQDMGLRVVFMMHNASGIVYPAAMLSYTHILRHLAAQREGDLRDLGIDAEREAPLDTFKKKRDAARRELNLPDQE